MTPIVNPWVFYLMPICGKISLASTLFGVFALIGAVITFVTEMCEIGCYHPDEDLVKMMRSFTKKFLAFGIVFILIGIFTPSETTITKMVVAQNVTYERVETVTDTVQTVYNDIMGLFENGEA